MFKQTLGSFSFHYIYQEFQPGWCPDLHKKIMFVNNVMSYSSWVSAFLLLPGFASHQQSTLNTDQEMSKGWLTRGSSFGLSWICLFPLLAFQPLGLLSLTSGLFQLFPCGILIGVPPMFTTLFVLLWSILVSSLVPQHVLSSAPSVTIPFQMSLRLSPGYDPVGSLSLQILEIVWLALLSSPDNRFSWLEGKASLSNY